MTISVWEAADDELPAIIALSEAEFPLYEHDHFVLKEIHRWTRNIVSIKDDGVVIGGAAALFLNQAGHAALFSDTLDLVRPSMHHLAATQERVAATYIWMWVSRKYGAESHPLILEWHRKRAPGSKLYGRPINDALKQLQASKYGGAPVSPGSSLWEFPNG